MAKKDLKYFMRSKEPETVTIPAPSSFTDDDGNVIQLEVQLLTQKRIDEINANYRSRRVATDKKGNPLIANGEVIWKTERDSVRATRHIVVEALKYPNLSDPQLMEYYDCVDVTDMPLLVFGANPVEYTDFLRNVLTALGLTAEATDDEDDKEAAKN